MENKMFCFQCEQTAGCSGCTGGAGVCGKTADVARLQDALTGALERWLSAPDCVSSEEFVRRVASCFHSVARIAELEQAAENNA